MTLDPPLRFQFETLRIDDWGAYLGLPSVSWRRISTRSGYHIRILNNELAHSSAFCLGLKSVESCDRLQFTVLIVRARNLLGAKSALSEAMKWRQARHRETTRLWRKAQRRYLQNYLELRRILKQVTHKNPHNWVFLRVIALSTRSVSC